MIEAKEKGATVIHADPRYTRTSAMADIHVPLRGGTDIAFLGGVINYILENDRQFTEYVRHHTNARVIINEKFRDISELDGVFSGWEPEDNAYMISTRGAMPVPKASCPRARRSRRGTSQATRRTARTG